MIGSASKIAVTCGLPFLAACAISGAALVPGTTPIALEDAPVLAATPACALAGTRLEYSVAVSGLPVGHAELAADARPGLLEVSATGGTNRVVDLLYPVRVVARTAIDVDGRAESFYLWVDEKGRVCERALSFHSQPCLYYKAPDQEAWLAPMSLFKDPIDPLALLLKLRNAPVDAQPHDFEVSMTLRSFCYEARCVGRADVEVPAGSFHDALVWRVDVRSYTELAPEPTLGPTLGSYEIAFSADARRLPLLLARDFAFGRVRLELEDVSEASPARAAALARSGS